MTKPNGEAIFKITVDSDDITTSSFADNSFQIVNTGDKKIAQIDFDITNALLPDSIFDPLGLGGDEAFKGLTIDTDGVTGVVTPDLLSFSGAGGRLGFEGFRLRFDENVNGGFESGETLGFSVDLDPNSIAGGLVEVLEAGSNPALNVGGISGAELIGSSFNLIFTDGTTATGQIQGAGNQAGGQALASQAFRDLPVRLRVNGLSAGDVGTYDEDSPVVNIRGRAGQTARVVLIKGTLQPETNEFFNGPSEQQAFAPVLQSQLDALAAEDFPANAAVEFQTVDVLLTGKRQNISDLFDFDNVADFDFAGEDQLPLGFTASIIDPSNDNLPLGPVTDPIYLQFEESDNTAGDVLYRVNAGGPEIAAIDGGISWSADTTERNSPFLADPGSNNAATSPAAAGSSLSSTTPDAIFDTERWDQAGGSEMQWAFDVFDQGLYEVRLLMGNRYQNTDDAGERIFDVALEGTVPHALKNIDLSAQFGHQVGGVISQTVSVTDGTLDIEFLHGVQNPLVNGIEIIHVA
jgi:hypothetical protein